MSGCPVLSRGKEKAVTEKNKGGRPSLYSEDLADEICERIANDEGLSAICRDPRMPTRTTVYRWCRESETFRDNYARAREDQGHTQADEMKEVRRKLEAGEIDAHTARVLSDILKWEAGKRSPRYYGDKIQHTGLDGETPVHTKLTINFVKAGDRRREGAIEGDWKRHDAIEDLGSQT
jgi:hypothetical protein